MKDSLLMEKENNHENVSKEVTPNKEKSEKKSL